MFALFTFIYIYLSGFGLLCLTECFAYWGKDIAFEYTTSILSDIEG
jgi:hypothetical protein